MTKISDKNKPLLYFILRILLVVVCVAIFYGLFSIVRPIILRERFIKESESLTTNGQLVRFAVTEQQVNDLLLQKEVPGIEFELASIINPFDSSICWERIHIQAETSEQIIFQFPDGCAPQGFFNVNPPIPIGILPFTSVDDPYYYPLDTRMLNMEIWLELTLEDENEETENLSLFTGLSFSPQFVDWDGTIKVTEAQLFESENNGTFAQIELRRPMGYVIITGLILLSMIIFIFALIFIKDTGSVLEASLGILLGLWGVQEILVPQNVNQPTWIEPLIITLYVLFVFAIFIRYIIRPIWGRFSFNKPSAKNTGTSTVQLDEYTLQKLINAWPPEKQVGREIPENTLYLNCISMLIPLFAALIGLLAMAIWQQKDR